MTTWREIKRAENFRKHGVDLALAERFDWSTAVIREDRDPAYGEQRECAIGYIEGQEPLYVYVYTADADGGDHAISLRKADRSEIRQYANETW